MRNKEILPKLEESLTGGIDLLEKLKRIANVDFATGFPCGELKDFILSCNQEKNTQFLHIPATNEREAVGIAAGAWLAGKKPVVYMQNSGLFVSSNEIGSLLIASRMPMMFVLSWRGAPGETATQHLATGAATVPLLSALGIDYITDISEESVIQLYNHMEEKQLPIVILKRREQFNLTNGYFPWSVKKGRILGDLYFERGLEVLSREDALRILLCNLDTKTAVFSSTGLISRSIFENFDGPNFFYNSGGFGVTSSIALGFAISEPSIPTIIIEGDGSVLTNLGNLNLIGYYRPRNLLHVVLDNQSLVSCSGEPTIGSEQIPRLACQLGYKNVYSLVGEDRIRQIFDQLVNMYKGLYEGPQMLHIRINSQGRRDFKRPLEMERIARRFREHFLRISWL